MGRHVFILTSAMRHPVTRGQARCDSIGIGQAELIGADIYSFLQKEDALKHVNESSVLGLSICKAIVDVLGGEFYMDTEYDKKTVASFWFPCKMRDTQKEHRAFSID